MKIGVEPPVAAGDADGQDAPRWPAIRSFAERAEALGFDSIWVPDHLLPHLDALGGPGAIHEAWTLVAALAASTSRIEIGTLVIALPWRNPALLAKMAVEADEVSGGRLILGIGTGYHEPEFAAFGYPPADDRPVARFEEALQILVPLLRGETVTFTGRFHAAHEAVLLPPPSRRIPLLIAARGPRLLRVTARWADAWNTAWFHTPDERFESRMAAFDEALAAEGRPTNEVVRTVGIRVGDESREEITERLVSFEAKGADHLIVRFEPKPTDVRLERVAAAVETYRAGMPVAVGA